jgi:hypothetical protein
VPVGGPDTLGILDEVEDEDKDDNGPCPRADEAADDVNETIRAELAAAAEAVERYRIRVESLVESAGPESDDLVAAMWEAERALLSAHRLLVRAGKLAR